MGVNWTPVDRFLSLLTDIGFSWQKIICQQGSNWPPFFISNIILVYKNKMFCFRGMGMKLKDERTRASQSSLTQEALVRLSLSIIPIPLKQNILFLYINMIFEIKRIQYLSRDSKLCQEIWLLTEKNLSTLDRILRNSVKAWQKISVNSWHVKNFWLIYLLIVFVFSDRERPGSGSSWSTWDDTEFAKTWGRWRGRIWWGKSGDGGGRPGGQSWEVGGED